MKVLLVSSLALFQDTRFGGSKRLYYLAKELEGRVDLSVLCFDGSREWPEGKPFPSDFRRSLFVPLPRRMPPWRRAGFLPGVDAAIADNGKKIEDFLGDGSFDATWMAYPIALRFLGGPWKARLGRKVYFEDDLLIENYRRRARSGSLPGRWRDGWRHAQALRFFRREWPKLDLFVCITREEEAVVQTFVPGLPTRLLKYGLPLAEYPFLPPPSDRRVLGFLANFHHTPNLDALAWLADELFPGFAREVPGARLVIAGLNLPQGLKARFASQPGVTVQENVRDLADFYRGVGVFINPIRQGRGLRTKLIEAAAFGRPILSTSLGAEGLEELAIARCETAADFVAAHRRLDDPHRWAGEAAGNRAAVERGFSVAKLGDDLADMLAGKEA
jgi:glycosyltransferase involved in cell wall biosynthesis